MTPLSLNNNFDNWAQVRQTNYEYRLLRQLLSYVQTTGSIKQLEADVGDNFGFGWFNTTYSLIPIYLGCVKLRNPITLTTFSPGICSKGRGAEFYNVFCELRQDQSEKPFTAVVFDYHGDALPDMVLTDFDMLGNEQLDWLLSFKMFDKLTDTYKTMHFLPWKDFCGVIQRRFTM